MNTTNYIIWILSFVIATTINLITVGYLFDFSHISFLLAEIIIIDIAILALLLKKTCTSTEKKEIKKPGRPKRKK